MKVGPSNSSGPWTVKLNGISAIAPASMAISAEFVPKCACRWRAPCSSKRWANSAASQYVKRCMATDRSDRGIIRKVSASARSIARGRLNSSGSGANTTGRMPPRSKNRVFSRSALSVESASCDDQPLSAWRKTRYPAASSARISRRMKEWLTLGYSLMK